MKKLFEQSNSGYSWNNRHTYYLCESEEEYNQLVDKYKDHDNGHYEYDDIIGREVWRSSYMQVTIDTMISARPQTTVSDGYAVRGGHDFKAKGITIKYCSSGLSSDNSSYEHYVKPGTIETDNFEKAEGWWV